MLKLGRWAAMAAGVWALATPAHALPAVEPAPPEWNIDFTSGVFWKVGGGATPLSYTLLPQIISLKGPQVGGRRWGKGVIRLRSRYSLLLEPILHGPERYFAGLAAAGELEWRDDSQKFAAFFSSGGGFGWMNSKGYEIRGAQGQDFNLNWLMHGGARFRLGREWWVSGGLYFQHISNHGMDKINPGLNALGPTLGVTHKF